MKHELKSWPEFFQPVWVCRKTFEIRKNDRQFKVDDEVLIREWEPPKDGEESASDYEGYSGREIEGVIEYVTTFLQEKGYCVFQFRVTLLKE